MSMMGASSTTHRPKSRHDDHATTSVTVAAILLQEELPTWKAELCEEVLSVYRETEVGKADGGAGDAGGDACLSDGRRRSAR